VESLNREELARFREWFQRFDSEAWDRQIEADVDEGRLDGLADQAVREHDRGRSREI